MQSFLLLLCDSAFDSTSSSTGWNCLAGKELYVKIDQLGWKWKISKSQPGTCVPRQNAWASAFWKKESASSIIVIGSAGALFQCRRRHRRFSRLVLPTLVQYYFHARSQKVWCGVIRPHRDRMLFHEMETIFGAGDGREMFVLTLKRSGCIPIMWNRLTSLSIELGLGNWSRTLKHRTDAIRDILGRQDSFWIYAFCSKHLCTDEYKPHNICC